MENKKGAGLSREWYTTKGGYEGDWGARKGEAVKGTDIQERKGCEGDLGARKGGEAVKGDEVEGKGSCEGDWGTRKGVL